jgi:signal transduction histidine kinase
MGQNSELIDFRRAFWWLLGGVLLPSVALVAFGVVAVANERAAVERRLAIEYDAKLAILARVLTGRVQAAAQAGDGDRVLARLPAELPEIALETLPRPERATFHLLALPDRSTPLETLRRALAEAAPGRGAVVAKRALPPPLEGWLLTAELPGDDPAAEVALRNRTLYIALLALLYSSIGVGFALTLRELFQAAKLSRLKTDFVANISHELRTPLTSVRLFAQTLQSGRASSPEEVRECLDLLARESERLSLLVEKLLDWSRLESGRRTLHREATSVEDLFAQVGEIFRAQQLGVEIASEVEPGLPPLLIDRDAMAQVVLNLLHNAVKYTGPDKRIRLRARRAGRRIAIEVEDNGPGIRPGDRKRIFERFYRADDLLSRRTEGTGLGLAIAKRIVDAHHGAIELESHVGVGSLFRVLLAAAPGPQRMGGAR